MKRIEKVCAAMTIGRMFRYSSDQFEISASRESETAIASECLLCLDSKTTKTIRNEIKMSRTMPERWLCRRRANGPAPRLCRRQCPS